MKNQNLFDTIAEKEINKLNKDKELKKD